MRKQKDDGVHAPALSLSLWLENQNNEFATGILLGFKTFDLLVTKTLPVPPTPEVKPFPVYFQAGPFEDLINKFNSPAKSG